MSNVERPQMSCIFVGGVANGLFITSMDMGATAVELGRPQYVKPLASSKQENPDVVKESDIYIIHPIGLAVDDTMQAVYGIAVVEGMDISHAFEEIIIGFVRDTAEQLAKTNKERLN